MERRAAPARRDDGESGPRLAVGSTGSPALLLLHGWPDGFLRYERVAPLLADAFDVVVPSIPGYGFSERPTTGGTAASWVAARLAEVMSGLGIERFGVHGGDIGTSIAEQLALSYPQRVAGLHLLDVPAWRLDTLDASELSPDETAWRDGIRRWSDAEGAYNALQRTKPQTLAAGLTDSPAGLASWFLEKFQAWGDGDVFDRIPIDTLADNGTLYWVTRTAGSAARYYYESRLAPRERSDVTVRTGFAQSPHDIDVAPRSFAERFYPVAHWTEFPRGGHFVAMEEPQLLADDLRAFFS